MGRFPSWSKRGGEGGGRACGLEWAVGRAGTLVGGHPLRWDSCGRCTMCPLSGGDTASLPLRRTSVQTSVSANASLQASSTSFILRLPSVEAAASPGDGDREPLDMVPVPPRPPSFRP